jgi:glucokinase
MFLSGDIGGTHTRLLLSGGDGAPPVDRSLMNREFPSFDAALARFLDDAGRPPVTSAAIAVAGPVLGGHVRMTNLGWSLDERVLSAALGGARVRLLNDLEAAAYGVTALSEADVRTIALGEPRPGGNVAVIAAGTGLGEALLAWHDETPVAIASEGGHADFAPRDATDVALLEFLAARYGHVSWERVLSGPGIANVYEFLRDTGREEEPGDLAVELAGAVEPSIIVTRAALAGEHPICVRALEIFLRAYGAEAGNLALKGLALGGVYVAGGIAPRLLDGHWCDLFMEAFVAKGRYVDMLRRVPVRVVLSERASLLGAGVVVAL